MQELKAVIDSNILVSILKGSVRLSPIYSAFRTGSFILVINSDLLKELSAVLNRPQLKISPNDIKELFRLIKLKAARVKSPKPHITACRDPKDNFILELALEAKAEFIVTGDNDLLVLNPFRGVSIVKPEIFIKRLKE